MAVANSSDVHVIPRNDLIIHDENRECVCIPSIEVNYEEIMTWDKDTGYPVYWYIIKHHSLDGRELEE